jgi:hypothetical protein
MNLLSLRRCLYKNLHQCGVRNEVRFINFCPKNTAVNVQTARLKTQELCNFLITNINYFSTDYHLYFRHVAY